MNGTPLGLRGVEAYAEDRCSWRPPLVVLGIAMPVLVIAAVVAGMILHAEGFALLVIPPLIIWLATGARYLPMVWPTGIRIDGDGVRIGAVRRWERKPDRKRRRKPPPASFQHYHVFSCPWRGILALEVTTDRKRMRELDKTAHRAPSKNLRATGGLPVAAFYLGMLTAPFAKAELIIEIDPEYAQFPTFRDVQALFAGTSQAGTRSTTWVVPTRRPRELTRLVAAITSTPEWNNRILTGGDGPSW
ncbi:hypothetical protein [Amycolatopsis alkalitolerans]|uniref:Uncharacterized protein n=1 Tax=Amycolatopsis alkalitolerans TaxID=2547244 RepID=A0A5C4M1U9_9PSEU|nr:hypothetical protein [Amycolatopsis alkalitolerans]TNC26032.1 hypothetical protein FG385_12690 [Amycolatopsis alkalitolerans]